MQVTVHYATQVKRVLGVAAEIIDMPESCTAADVVLAVADRHGEAVRELLVDDRGDVQPTLLVFVGDRQVARREPCPPADRDVLTIMTPISGG